jgi:hypothetical protein
VTVSELTVGTLVSRKIHAHFRVTRSRQEATRAPDVVEGSGGPVRPALRPWALPARSTGPSRMPCAAPVTERALVPNAIRACCVKPVATSDPQPTIDDTGVRAVVFSDAPWSALLLQPSSTKRSAKSAGTGRSGPLLRVLSSVSCAELNNLSLLLTYVDPAVMVGGRARGSGQRRPSPALAGGRCGRGVPARSAWSAEPGRGTRASLARVGERREHCFRGCSLPRRPPLAPSAGLALMDASP